MRKSYSFSFLFLLFHTIVGAQEYTYDINGNLKSDSNKQISSIHYNHLNLVDTITYADGRKMIYTYTATGQKLREQSLLGNGSIKQKRDYVDHFLYRNDSLREIGHEDGRAVPEPPGNNATHWEYQYHLNDHLGNVRSILTSKQETEANTSTFESVAVATEQNKYLRYAVVRKINSILFDHTHTGTTHYAERLNGSANERYGIARSLSVMPGDTIRLEVYAKYVDPNRSNLTGALTTLLTQIASGTAPAGMVVDGTGYATNGNIPFLFAGLNNTSGSTGTGPKAYLNWLVFDRDFAFKNGGYVRMTTAAKENGSNVPHERLLKQFVIREPGYVYMYLSNEETMPLEVYFDDVSVKQVKGPVIHESDYDPFGLTFNEYTREHAVPNNFLYNGKELQNDFDLNWYDYGARMYDAALGRWHVVDPMSEKYTSWSPYAYVLNNPVKFVDPDGRNGELVLDRENQTATVHANYYVYSHGINKVLEGMQVWSEMSGKEKMQIENEQFTVNFSITVFQVSGGDPEAIAKGDPIGNSISMMSDGQQLVSDDGKRELGGVTLYSKNITVPADASGVEVAHEIGHTFLGSEGKEHVPNTIMDEVNLDQGNRINSDVVNKIKQTYGLMKNDFPTTPQTGMRRTGTKMENLYNGENFRIVYVPKGSNEEIRWRFEKTHNTPRQ